jgi:hypothetical protein
VSQPVTALLRASQCTSLSRAGFAATGPEMQKFLRRFFQKAALSFKTSS